MLRPALALAGIVVGWAVPALAGTNAFTLVGPDGGFVRKVSFHPAVPTILHAVTGAGYYRSTDSGLTWRLSGENLQLQFPPEDVAVDPSDPNRVILALPGRGLAISTDAGATLAFVGGFPASLGDARHVEYSADGSVVYASAGIRFLRSSDSGRTWSERTPVPSHPASGLQFVRVDPRNSDVVYVYDLNAGGFRSSNGGDSWASLPLPANTFDLAITGTTPQRIWAASANTGVHLSTDGGASFPQIFPAVGGVPMGALSIALDPQNQSIVYAALSPFGLFRSPDGNAWTQVHGNAPYRPGQFDRGQSARLHQDDARRHGRPRYGHSFDDSCRRHLGASRSRHFRGERRRHVRRERLAPRLRQHVQCRRALPCRRRERHHAGQQRYAAGAAAVRGVGGDVRRARTVARRRSGFRRHGQRLRTLRRRRRDLAVGAHRRLRYSAALRRLARESGSDPGRNVHARPLRRWRRYLDAGDHWPA